MAYGSTEYGSDVEINPIKHSNDAALNKGCSSHLRAIQESEMSDGLSDAGCSERIDLKQVKTDLKLFLVMSRFDM